jgi:hypothetical protein
MYSAGRSAARWLTSTKKSTGIDVEVDPTARTQPFVAVAFTGTLPTDLRVQQNPVGEALEIVSTHYALDGRALI